MMIRKRFGDECVRGYIVEPGKEILSVLLVNTPSNIAAFIASRMETTIVTDFLESLVIAGRKRNVVDCPDPDYLKNRISPELTRMQLNGKIPKLIYAYEYEDEDQ